MSLVTRAYAEVDRATGMPSAHEEGEEGSDAYGAIVIDVGSFPVKASGTFPVKDLSPTESDVIRSSR